MYDKFTKKNPDMNYVVIFVICVSYLFNTL